MTGAAAGTPLAGTRVVVTRATHQAEPLCEHLGELGAEVARLPLIEVVPPSDSRPLERAASELALYDWLVFTSSNAVESFLPPTGGSLPTRLQVAAVGQATADALRDWEIEPHLLPAQANAEGLIAELAPRVGRRQRILLPQAADARATLADGLLQAGAEPVTVVAYDKRLPSKVGEQALDLFSGGFIGWVTFTSPRIARHFFELIEPLGPDLRSLRAASIGPVTTAELRRLGAEPAAVAKTPSSRALAEAINESISGG